MINIQQIPPEFVGQMWPQVEPLLAKAIEKSNGELTTDDLFRFVREELMQLLGFWDGDRLIGACCSEVVNYPQITALRLTHLGGERMDEWQELFADMVERAAKKIGADVIEIHGRAGWAKPMKQYGMEHKYSVMTKRIS